MGAIDPRRWTGQLSVGLIVFIWFGVALLGIPSQGATVPLVPCPIDGEIRSVLPAFVRPLQNTAKGSGVELGEFLFFDRRLSDTGEVSCADCHTPQNAFALPPNEDFGAIATPSLTDIADSTWFFWDGRADSLWSAARLAIIVELGGSAQRTVDLISENTRYRELFEQFAPSLLTGKKSAEEIFFGINMAIGDYLRSIRSPESRFDRFAAAVVRGDTNCLDHITSEEVVGLTIFLGRGQCASCHFGPSFSDDSFHDIGAHPNPNKPAVDRGRYDGIAALLASPYNASGPFSDLHPSNDIVVRLAYLSQGREWWSAFKTPRLRMAARTGPFMHNNMLSTLAEVVDFYDRGGNPPLADHHGESILRPLGLSDEEKQGVVAFLEMLSDW